MDQLRRHLNRLLIAAAGLLLVACGLSAQTTATGTVLQFVALADFPGRDQLHYLRSATDAVAVAIPVMQRSEALKPKSIASPIILALKKTDPTTGAVAYEPVAQVDWPAGAQDRALVFIAPAAGGRVGAVAVDDSLKTFPSRTLRAVNFSGLSLVGKFGSFQGTIPPGVSPAVPFPKVDAPAGVIGRFRVGVARQDDSGNVKLVYNGWADAWPSARTLLIIRQEGDRVQVRTLVETLPEPDRH